MRTLELRRHTMRVKPGQHLSQAGVDLARRVGENRGTFDYVVTSTIPRAYETAIAMGFAVDEQLDALCMIADGVEHEVAWDAGFAAIATAVWQGGATTRYAQAQAEAMYQIVGKLPEGGSALVVSHGFIVECQVIGCLPDIDFSSWGGFCDYCEGARLVFDGERFVSGEVLRVKKDNSS